MIENSIYSNLGNKINKTAIKSSEFENLLTLKVVLKDVQEKNWHNVSQEIIIKSFCNDLKELLEKESIFEMTEELFNIEHLLDSISTELDSEYEIPNMDDFYKKLSPTILRSLWEASKVNGDANELIHGWKESLRISIEEEFYVWQEKMIL